MRIDLVLFYDHAKNTRTPLLCTVVGFFLKEDEDYLCLTWWYTHNLDTEQELLDNQEPFVILKSAIVKRWKLTVPALFDKILTRWLKRY